MLPLMQLIISIVAEKIEKEEKAVQFPNEDVMLMFKIADQWWDSIDP